MFSLLRGGHSWRILKPYLLGWINHTYNYFTSIISGICIAYDLNIMGSYKKKTSEVFSLKFSDTSLRCLRHLKNLLTCIFREFMYLRICLNVVFNVYYIMYIYYMYKDMVLSISIKWIKKSKVKKNLAIFFNYFLHFSQSSYFCMVRRENE